MYLAIYAKGLWTQEIISYWSDKLSSILDYFTLVDRQKLYFTNSAQKSGVVYHVLESPRVSEFRRTRVPPLRVHASPRPHVLASLRPHVPASPRPRVPTSPRPRVRTSPRPHIPTSPRPRVPASSSPRVFKSQVPLLVTALLW